MPEDKYQIIHLDLPNYLLSYFACKIKQTLIHTDNYSLLEIDRFSALGKDIHKALVPALKPETLDCKEGLYLKISNYSGNNYKSPRGDTNFLTLEETTKHSLIEQIKSDFNSNLINYVEGAEFAHMHNGWTRDQKRRGIRKTAIIQFCEKYKVSFTETNLESFVKMIQRAQKNAETLINSKLKKYNQSLSY